MFYGVSKMFGLSSICDVPKGVDSEEVHGQDGDYIDEVSGLRNGEVHGHNNTATDELFRLRHGGDVREVDDHEATALNEGCE